MKSSKEENDKLDKTYKKCNEKKSITVIFRYADWIDVLLMLLGSFGAIGDGMAINWFLVSSSQIMNTLGYGKRAENQETFMNEVEKTIIYFVYLGLAVFVVAFMEGYCWSWTSERQVLRIRHKYLESVLRQEVGFFDSQEASTSEIINSISKDTSLIQEVLSEKVPLFLNHTSNFVSGLAFSIYFSWRLFLVAFPLIFLLVIPGIIYGKYLIHLTRKSAKEYGKANTIVEQALSSIRTIYSFTAEKRTVERYSAILNLTMKLGIKQGLAKGLAIGSTGLTYSIWALLGWYGSRLIMYKGETPGRIYSAGLSFVMGGRCLGVAFPDIKYFTKASIAAARLFERIDRVPKIDGENVKGLVLNQIHGELTFDHIQFTYPSAPNTIVLKDFNLKVQAGQTVALVGASGSGKSTAIALLQRFYDSDKGVVLIDGVDIKTLQLKWLRGNMGLVSQEHALFGTTIKENIMFGKPDAPMDEIIAATMAANAHNFIRQLPEGYETKVGECGALLSGGQKQRIAIARAIIRNPAILLLDEATSALDSESEVLVQRALDQASMGRTTLVVAHKLSTIKNADQIAVVNGGCILEIGSHSDLITKTNGHYAKMQTQFRNDDHEQVSDSYISSVTRSSAHPLNSLTKFSPASFSASPFHVDNLPIIAPSYPPPSFYRLLAMNSPEWKHGLIGGLSAITFGAVQPVAAITIGGMISVFFVHNHEEMKARIHTYSLIFSFLSIVCILVNVIQHYNFAYMGEQLTRRIRLQLLEKLLTFEVAWFDHEQNSSGALSSRLSNEASMVKSLVADRVSLLVQTSSAIVTATIMSLLVAWKLALVLIALQPVTILCLYIQKVLLSSVSHSIVKAQHLSTQIAVEAVYNHRIITSFGSVTKVLELFDKVQEQPRKDATKKAWFMGIGMGSALSVTFLSWALEYWYGGKLVDSGQISAGDVFKIFIIWVTTSKVIAETGSMTSDLAKGATAVASLFEVLDRQTLISRSHQVGSNVTGIKLKGMTGAIELNKVDFAYPNRPDRLVLHQFCLKVAAGSSIGLVGKSGCGKSTVIGLIQRFYDVSGGAIKVDGVDLRQLDVNWYRKHVAVVSQEPVIYSGTIHDNIIFGNNEASETEVVEAAKAANAHEFISTLKEGYETECGERGMQLSGGQKQRIAIARAIVRNPNILLLDEATSALDVHSEQVVQKALDRIMLKRTTIVVAHRFNTIKKVNSIAFVEEGRVTEQGTYQELNNNKGSFFNLAKLQK
ncbi:hypothetical protein C5167_018601 [Papaver somniferum]|uniref:Uncharacterized protein n=1 Tax=Papaver somniferum TaxID=3469 RepID=A0A4Y7IPY3_PAPSO|nr:putative ABC transporter B family member 8 [Papaver somniferum]RZC50176.1 hypothetical protein C5167_018601 [Papaver somniferum]